MRRRRNNPTCKTDQSNNTDAAISTAAAADHEDGGATNTPSTATTTTVSLEASSSFSKDPLPPSLSSPMSLLLLLLIVLLHLAGVTFCIVGAVLAHRLLHTHADECDMTWSHRVFLPIDDNDWGANNTNTNANTQYKLYKFVDARDARHWPYYYRDGGGGDPVPKKKTLAETYWWCAADNHRNHNPQQQQQQQRRRIQPVLYIPGHGGNYQQARSLGAHALGLTQRSISVAQQRRILNPNHTADVPLLDVYTVDLGEQGTALHGHYATQQTEFVVQVIQRLVDSCLRENNNASDSGGGAGLVLVGHSMGGLVALAAAAQLQQLQPQVQYVDSIVTLSTPHQRPVLAVEGSLIQWHQQQQLLLLQQQLSSTPVIAISGGVRDEMLPPEATHYSNHDDSTTNNNNDNTVLYLLSADIMKAPTVGHHHHQQQQQSPLLLGSMDHRAVVWCHNLLAPVRQILLSLVETSSMTSSSSSPTTTKQQQRLQAIRQRLSIPSDYDYTASVQRQRQKLRSLYGTWTARAMETGVLYNLEWLVWFYAFLGAAAYVYSDSSYCCCDDDSATTTIAAKALPNDDDNNKSRDARPAVAGLVGPLVCLGTLTWLSSGGENHYLSPPPLGSVSMFAIALTANALLVVIQGLVRRLIFWRVAMLPKSSPTTTTSITEAYSGAVLLARIRKLYLYTQMMIVVLLLVVVVVVLLVGMGLEPSCWLDRKRVSILLAVLSVYAAVLVWTMMSSAVATSTPQQHEQRTDDDNNDKAYKDVSVTAATCIAEREVIWIAWTWPLLALLTVGDVMVIVSGTCCCSLWVWLAVLVKLGGMTGGARILLLNAAGRRRPSTTANGIMTTCRWLHKGPELVLLLFFGLGRCFQPFVLLAGQVHLHPVGVLIFSILAMDMVVVHVIATAT